MDWFLQNASSRLMGFDTEWVPESVCTTGIPQKSLPKKLCDPFLKLGTTFVGRKVATDIQKVAKLLQLQVTPKFLDIADLADQKGEQKSGSLADFVHRHLNLHLPKPHYTFHQRW
jgi:hypothetical protein